MFVAKPIMRDQMTCVFSSKELRRFGEPRESEVGQGCGWLIKARRVIFTNAGALTLTGHRRNERHQEALELRLPCAWRQGPRAPGGADPDPDFREHSGGNAQWVGRPRPAVLRFALRKRCPVTFPGGAVSGLCSVTLAPRAGCGPQHFMLHTHLRGCCCCGAGRGLWPFL